MGEVRGEGEERTEQLAAGSEDCDSEAGELSVKSQDSPGAEPSLSETAHLQDGYHQETSRVGSRNLQDPAVSERLMYSSSVK